MKRAIALCVSLLSVTSLFAGPFGIEMGMTIEQVKAVSTSEPVLVEEDIYEIFPVTTHSRFEKYTVRISKEYGVYFIKAIGVDIRTSKYGEEMLSEFNDLVSSFQKKYGKYERIDYLKKGSYWDEPEDWMMGLLKNERYLLAFWEIEIGSDLPENIVSIYIGANAASTEVGLVAIEYYSVNFEKATEERKSKEDDVF